MMHMTIQSDYAIHPMLYIHVPRVMSIIIALVPSNNLHDHASQ